MRSQNGRPVLERYGGPLVATYIPGTQAKFAGGVLAGDINLIAMYLGHRWNTEIEQVLPGFCWGYALRPVRGRTDGYSNHASGTAGDINAPLHPLGVRTLSHDQLARLRKISNALGDVVRFGAFYTDRKDEMHWEIVASDDAVAEVAAKIRHGILPNVPDELRDVVVVEKAQKPSSPAPAPSKPTAPKPPAPKPKPTDWFDMASKEEVAAIVSVESAKALRTEGVSGAGDWAALARYLAPLVKQWNVEAILPLLRSEGISGAADVNRFRDALLPALRETFAQYGVTAVATSEQITDTLLNKLTERLAS